MLIVKVNILTVLAVMQFLTEFSLATDAKMFEFTRNESLSFPGKRLVGHVIEEFTTKKQVIHCAYECLKSSRCLSFNYEFGRSVCQLNDGDHVEFSDSLVVKDNETSIEYHQRNAFSIDQDALGPCALDPCQNGGRCLDTVNWKMERTFFCICADGWMGDNCDFQMNRIDWGEWVDWGLCSVTCEAGWTTRRRQCQDMVTGEVFPSTKCFGHDVEYKPCRLRACPRWDPWEVWGDCSTRDTCGPGVKLRHRTCANDGTPGVDRYCLGFTNEMAPCQGINCGGMLLLKNSKVHGQARIELVNDVDTMAEMAICADDNWDDITEDIACKQIGFEGVGQGISTTYDISMLSEDASTYRLICTGKDKTIQQCRRELVENCTELAGMHCRVRGGWSLWTSWGDCSVTCENGTRTRTRECNHPPPNFGGTPCPGDNLQHKPCTLSMCPVDGVWRTWSPWFDCDVTCANGTRFRTRECTGPFYGGSDCPDSDTDVEDCFPRMCPVDGVWNTWAAWSECSHTCGYGNINRTRTCDGPFYGGLECPGYPSDVETCNAFSCPVDGEWKSWGVWGECSVTCGGGSRNRTRECHNPLHGGATCTGPASETESCSEQICPIDGVFKEWEAWSDCSVTCANGTQTRYRVCHGPFFGGSECDGNFNETQVCMADECPVDGVWQPWQQWGSCSVTCRGGSKLRVRGCKGPLFGGNECEGATEDKADCNMQECPVDGMWLSWQQWGSCNVTCGGGSKLRVRVCRDPFFGGNECEGATEDRADCNMHECPVDGVFTDWEPWSDCSVTCANGTQTRYRMCHGPFFGGSECDGNFNETQVCMADECPVDGMWLSWQQWGSCNVTCGGGSKLRVRVCRDPFFGGNECEGATEDRADCNMHECPVDGEWKLWGVWGECSVTCGGGSRNRTRECHNPLHGGAACTGPASETEACSEQMCPIDGVFAEWETWSECSVTCANGTQTRSRECYGPYYWGSECDGNFKETQVCVTAECPVDGVWQPWQQWGSCNVTCGGASKLRVRICRGPFFGGNECEGATEDRADCNMHECPVDGIWQAWSNWTECTLTCGTGSQERNRTCYGPFHGGAVCPGDANETQSCNTFNCPVDGIWTDWNIWSKCSKSCGNGEMTRNRTCYGPLYDGAPCEGDTSETLYCKASNCPVDGVFMDWSGWADCDVTCGGGIQWRHRFCHGPYYDGADCLGPYYKSQDCNTQECSIDGVWEMWTAWGPCGVTCGGGTKMRSRDCDGPYHGGAICEGPSEDQIVCGTVPCSIPGKWLDWAMWSLCTVTCGGGTHYRNRTCGRDSYGNLTTDCEGDSEETAECHTFDCQPLAIHCAGWATRGLNQSCTADVDPDGEGFRQPVQVECDFDSEPGKAITVLHHNQENRTHVMGYEGGYEIKLDYNVGWVEVIKIVDASDECAQFMRWECKAALIHSSVHEGLLITYWMNRTTQKANYFGGATPGSGNCACGETNSCFITSLSCNCDADDKEWRSDEGWVTNKPELPIHSFYAGDTGQLGEEGYTTLGPVLCSGTA